MIIVLHTPEGTVAVDSKTVSDEQLAALNITREAFEELLPSSEKLRAKLSLEAIANLTPEQIGNYIDNNVKDLASAKAFLKKLSRVVVLLSRHLEEGE